MKYLVIYLSDNGNRIMSNKVFHGQYEAMEYRDTIDSSRKPEIIPYIAMNPPKGDEFRCDDMEVIARLISDLKDLIIFSTESAGMAPVVEHLHCQGVDQLGVAKHTFHIAALTQARESANRSLGR